MRANADGAHNQVGCLQGIVEDMCKDCTHCERTNAVTIFRQVGVSFMMSLAEQWKAGLYLAFIGALVVGSTVQAARIWTMLG